MMQLENMDVHLPLWASIAALAAGLSAAGLVFMLGYHLIRNFWPFLSPLPLAAAEDRFILGGGRERRHRPDKPVEVVVVEVAVDRRSSGVVVNRSQGGVAILMDESYEPGTVLSVRPPEADDEVPWIQVKVRHRQRSGRQWLMGCQFVEALPWNVWVWLG